MFVAESVGELYRDALRWAEMVRTANIDENFRPVLRPLGQMLDHVIAPVEQFGEAVEDRVNALLEAASGGEPAGS